MPNVVKYSTTAENNAIKKGNIAIGVNSVDYGGGGQSGWWNTIDVPTGGYVVYVNKASNGPSIMVPPNDTALVGAARSFGASASVTTAAGALNYFASQSDMMVVNKNYNNIVTSGLVLNLDASFVASYPLSGTSWYDISGSGNTGTLVNGPTFNTNGWIQFDGTNDQVNIANNTSLQITGNQTLEFIVYPERRDRRQNWYNKSYGGEGTITYETGGTMSYYYGTAGSDNQPYQGVGSAAPSLATLNRWYHVVLVRELSTPTKTVKWYINGSLNATSTASYTAATASTNQITLGNGYTNPFLGRLPLTRQYNIALSSSQVLQNYYGAPIVTNGLILSYDGGNLVSYDTTGTTIYDLSVSAYSGTLTNGPTYSVSGGGSILYDGVDDYITLPSSLSSLSGTSGASLSMWIKLDSGSNPSGQSGIIQLSSFTGSNGNLYYYTDASNVGGIWLDIFRTNRVTTGDWQPTFNGTIWHNLTVTCQSGTTGWKMYLNQNLAYQTSGPSVVSVDSSLFGGFRLGQNSGGRDLKGRVAICNIYNRVLSSSEVLQNFNAHRNRFGL